MSDVEQYWTRIAQAFNDSRPWHSLSPNEQMMIVQSINMLIMVLNNRQPQQEPVA